MDGADPQAFKTRMALIAARAKTAKNLEAILDDPDHPQFMKAVEFTSDRGFGKVPASVDLTSKGEKLSGVVILPPTEEAK